MYYVVFSDTSQYVVSLNSSKILTAAFCCSYTVVLVSISTDYHSSYRRKKTFSIIQVKLEFSRNAIVQQESELREMKNELHRAQVNMIHTCYRAYLSSV